MNVLVEGPDGPTTVAVGDYVCFKGDVESSGEIVEIRNGSLTVFESDCCGNERTHLVSASRCWVE